MAAPEKIEASLALTLFGPLQARVDGHPLPPMRSRKGLWLLALLILRHKRPVDRRWLAETLWPEAEPDRTFANLRSVLSELRKALGRESARLQSPDRHTLQLDLTGADVDLLVFDAAIADKTLSALEKAAGLYQGPLLEGCTEEWAFQERRIREQDCLQALQTLGESALEAGNYPAAVGHYQRAIRIDAWGDTARRGCMTAFAGQGDRNAALQVYREYVELLRSDPTAIPDAQTTALYRRLRAESREPIRSQAATAPREPASIPAVTGFLPHSLTDLVGREDECIAVAARLRHSRLVTLTGPGGIGKTRLALEVAKEVAGEYTDGVWLVSLEALSEGDLVATQIAATLGLRESPGRPLLERLTERLHRKQVLLVLDNCEHLLEASAQILGQLLRECAGIRILATSREALEIHRGDSLDGACTRRAGSPASAPESRAPAAGAHGL